MHNKIHETALVIFAREPVEGKVKTRLETALSKEIILSLYKAFVLDVAYLAKHYKNTQKFLYYDSVEQQPYFLNSLSSDFILIQQKGLTLGQRMRNAFLKSFEDNFKKVVIIGTDCLTITDEDLCKAFAQLDDYDCVLGPSIDGGYYLIGLKNADRDIFSSVEWGTCKVLNQTLTRIKQNNLTCYLLAEKNDIDTIADLKQFISLKKYISSAQHTAKIIEKYSLT